jgi:hypothetical protein
MARQATQTDILNAAVNYHLSDVNTCLPCTIVEYDDATMKATVQPLIKVRRADGVTLDMPPIVGVPVVQQGNDNFSITHPVKKGNTVLVLFFQRSIDNWVHSDGSSTIDPESFRKHDYNDAVAITGLYPFPNAVGSHSSDLVIRANIKSESESKIILKASGEIEIHSNAATTINASAATVNCNLTVNGDIHSTGTVTGDNDCVGGGKSLKGHTHDILLARKGTDTLTSQSPS